LKLRLADTGIIVTAAGGSGELIFSRAVGRIVSEFGLTGTSVILTVTRSTGRGVVSRTIGRSVLIFVFTTTVNVTFERRSHIVVILGTGISVINVGRGMHPVVFFAVPFNIATANILRRTAADIFTKIIGEPVDTGDIKS